MQQNPYNLISIQTDAYTGTAVLTVKPQSDSVIRVFMAFHSLSRRVDLPEQDLIQVTRNGFTVVEWGGCEVN